MVVTIKIIKNFTLLLNIAFWGLLVVNSLKPTVSQPSIFYVTIGHSGYIDHRIRSPEPGLKIGLNWAVFSLKRNRYLGTARVTENSCRVRNDCRKNQEGSELIARNPYPSIDEPLLLVRPIPKNPSIVNIKQISFSRLPTPVQQEVNKKSPRINFYRPRQLPMEEYYIIDLDSNGSPDLVKAEVINGSVATGYDSVFVRSGSTWTAKYERIWTWE